METDRRFARAVAVKDDESPAIGDEARIEAMRGPSKIVDARGKRVDIAIFADDVFAHPPEDSRRAVRATVLDGKLVDRAPAHGAVRTADMIAVPDQS